MNHGYLLKRAALILVLIILTAAIPVSASSDARVSPGLDVLQNELFLSVSALEGETLSLGAEKFDGCIGAKVESVTILSLPLVTEGSLKLGSLEVMKNQTISRQSLSMLCFVPAHDGICESSFRFSADTGYSSYAAACSLYVLETANYAPTVSVFSDGFTSVKTAKNVSYFGSLKASDPENDPLTYEIVSYPSKGLITVTDRAHGSYRYTPASGYTGRDSFEYSATDKYGNSTGAVKITINVEKPASDVVYADLDGHWAENAAIRMAGAGIMGGTLTSDGMCFLPDQSVSRAEFLVMAMKAVGFTPAASVIDTGFADDAQISDEYKPYVAAAAEMGYISGVVDENGQTVFYPDREITRAEAAVILNSMLGAKQPVVKPVFSDITSVPAWACDALYAMNELGILNGTGEGNISPSSILTRAQTAQILMSVIDL